MTDDERAMSIVDAFASCWFALALKYGGDPEQVLEMHRKYFEHEYAAADRATAE